MSSFLLHWARMADKQARACRLADAHGPEALGRESLPSQFSQSLVRVVAQ